VSFEQVFELFIVVQAYLCSLVSCLWLVYTLRRKSNTIRGRLFPRQMKSLAIANIVFAVILLILASSNITVYLGSDLNATFRFECHWAFICFIPARLVCLLHEMHIAVSFQAQAFRKTLLVHILSWNLSWLWVTGIGLGAISSWLNPWHFSLRAGTCMPKSWRGNADIMSVVMVIACGFVCVVSYCSVVIRACTERSAVTPAVVNSRNYRRAAMYPLSYLLTYGPILISYCEYDLFNSYPWFSLFARTMEAYSGFANTIVYFLQSRYASRQLKSGDANGALAYEGHQICSITGRMRLHGSYTVHIGGVDIFELLDPETLSVYTDDSRSGSAQSVTMDDRF